jgi:HD domain
MKAVRRHQQPGCAQEIRALSRRGEHVERARQDQQPPDPASQPRSAQKADGSGAEHVVAALNPVRLRRYLWQVAAATFLVAVCPVLVVWWLRASGTIGTALLGMALAVGLSLGASYVGSAFWETRTGSGDLLFGELMVWGFIRRRRNDRRLASALQLLGPMNQAQRRVTDGLSAEAQAKALEQLGAALEAVDPYTHGHSRRVARNAWMLARRMGLGREEVARIRTAAAVHDVGKLETPTSVLRKRGPLTDAEFEVIKRHPVDGARMAAVLGDAELTSIIRHHHERLDGTGYPSGLSGKAIPLGARIIAVADTFDAITSARPYRPARSHKQAINILKYEAGVQLDPSVVRAFCRLYSGRGPLALWASMTSLPAQVFSWIGGGVAGVTTAAQVAAVAAAAAVGTATIARPADRPHPKQIVSTKAVAANRQMHPGLASAARGPTVAGRQQRPGPSHRAHRRPVVHGTPVGGGSRTASSSAPSSGAGISSQPSGSATTGSGYEHSPGSESKGGGKPEEAKGTPEEAKGKPEEAKSKPEEAKGKPEEAKGGGKPEEAKGKPEEAKGKG